MIPTLQHTQPLVRDLSLQPEGRYLLTVYGLSSSKYFFVDELVEGEESLAFHRGNDLWATVVLPKGSLWTLIARDELEYPTLEAISRQTKTDQDNLRSLEKELYPHKKIKGLAAFPEETSGNGELPEAYPGQSKQYL